MNRTPLPPDDSWESDAVWKLLDQAPPRAAGPRFADDTARSARLAGAPRSWWLRFMSPIPLAGLAAASMAALAIAIISLNHSPIPTAPPIVAANDEAFAEIQELAETEALCAAVDNLDDFSDNELINLMGF